MSVKVYKAHTLEDLFELTSGNLVEDQEGITYLTFVPRSGGTGLLLLGCCGTVKECIAEEVNWPVKLLPKDSYVTIHNKG